MNGSGGPPRRSAAAAGGGGGGGGGGGNGSSGVGEPPPIATLVVYKDEAGYGMKVSGDNPVYVQSVKEGGAAARAGLHSGDKIIKVNGVNVMQSTHTDVVQLIKSSTQVVLTVQQKPATGVQSPLTAHQIQRPVSLSGSGTGMVSLPSPPTSTPLHRAWTAPAPCGAAPSTARITGPQPVDVSPKSRGDYRSKSEPTASAIGHLLQRNLLHPATVASPSTSSSSSVSDPISYLSLTQRSPNASSSPLKQRNHEKLRQLETQRVNTFQQMLETEQQYLQMLRDNLAKAGAGGGGENNVATWQTELVGAERRVRTLQDQLTAITNNGQLYSLVTNTPPSPKLPYSPPSDVPPPLPSRKSLSVHNLAPPPLPPRPTPMSNTHNTVQSDLERHQLTHLTPPANSHGIPTSFTQGANLGSAVLNKHQRTKSSPEQLGTTNLPCLSPAEASRRLIASESMNDLSRSKFGRHSGIDLDDPPHITPPGTPPPPYPQSSGSTSDQGSLTINDSMGESFVTVSPVRQPVINESSPGLPPIQQPIMSMEDDDMSDQEVGQLEDHGPFKSLSRLWEHHAHLAVFINYVLSNSDPSSLLFYLITDLYKEGNAKEMRKWAYEIHSSFLVPGAPLRLNNVDENVAREIDDVLLKESDKEEILRKIFWKARARAKEELNEQLADFQQKRTAGLGTLFGPSDAQLDESTNDKAREAQVIDTFLLPKMEPYQEDTEKERDDSREFTTAAGLATILTKIFQVRAASLDRFPTFVSKDKSNFKARLLTGKTRKLTVRGHHFVVHQYFTVTYCNHCQLIIWGVGPQGYQCSDCSLNVHRQCVHVVDENCPGPLVVRKEKGDRISKFMGIIRPERKPPSSHHHLSQHFSHNLDRVKKSEDDSGVLTDGENVKAEEVKSVYGIVKLPSYILTGVNERISGETVRVVENIADSSSSSSSSSKVSPNCATTTSTSRDNNKVIKISKAKAKAKAKAKSKSLKSSRSSSLYSKNSIAGRVWERLGAVRKTRSAGDIADVDQDNRIVISFDKIIPPPPPPSSSSSLLLLPPPPPPHPSATANKEVHALRSADKSKQGDHRGGGFGTGSAGGNSERGRGSSGYGTGAEHAESMDDPSSREDIAEMFQPNIPSKPKTSTINRSESYKEQRMNHKRHQREKRKTSDPNLSKTKAGFSDCEATGTFPGNSAGSSSTSSLSTRSLDSLSTSLEHVHPAATSANTTTSWDSDVDVEADPPDWSQGVAEDVLARLTNSEKKRQEVINELFHTERSHVRALRVLSQVFHKPMVESQVLPQDQILLLFSNLDEMLEIHSGFNQAMKSKKKENPCVGDVGDLLLSMFDGPAGEAFEKAASTYCAKQQVALDSLRDRRKKDPKLHAFLNEVEANPLCRRLQLKDHILTGMLRLTKYPLLFENLAKYTPASNEKEKAAVIRSLERSKEVLNQVNQAVRVAEDYHRLAEIQRTMDRSAFDKFDHSTVNEFRNLDITKRKLIYEGPLQWRMVNRAKPVDLHVVLLDDTILLLHRQDEKYLLKFINTNQVNSVLSPIVKVSTVLVRHNAVDKNSLYLVNTSQSGAQIYELVANSPTERKLWFKHITEACEAFKTRDREGRRPPHPVPPVEEPSPLVQDTSTADNDANSSKGDQEETQLEEVTPEEPAPSGENRDEEENSNAAVEAQTETEKPDQPEEPEQERQTETTEQPQQSDRDSVNTSVATGACGDPLRLVTCTQSSLIEPDEVRVEVRPIHLAEPVLTPIERLRRKDALIKEALMEKQALVADILNVPREDFEHLADMASEPSGIQKEPTELILAAVSQANQLMEMLNTALNVTETETVLASRGASISTVGSCEASGCPAPRSHSLSHRPSIPVASLQPVCSSLASQLSQLLEIVKDREEERERMRRELRRSREKLHAIDADTQRRGVLLNLNTSTHTQTDPSESLNGEGFVELNLDEFVDAFSDPEQDQDSSTQALGEHRLTEVDVEENPHGVGDSVG